jgi:hypothetical protein
MDAIIKRGFTFHSERVEFEVSPRWKMNIPTKRGMMRKSKRSIAWEEPSESSSKELDAGLDDLDEEIIDLEEVIEADDDRIEEDDELSFNAEVLDAETGLDFRDFEGKVQSEDEFLVEEDLLNDLSFFQDRKAEPDPPGETAAAINEPEDFNLELLLGSSKGASEEAKSSEEALVPEETQPEDPALALLLASMEGALEEAGHSGDAPAPQETKAKDDASPVGAPVEATVSLDEFITQIESKLVDTVREMVESRLPEIVRTVLREEIERLKNDHEPEA